MEAYVFAMMANSGTDPDLEEEDALREMRERELELRYLIKAENAEDSSDSQMGRLLEEADARLQAEPAVQDHYSICGHVGETMPSSDKYTSSLRSQTSLDLTKERLRPCDLSVGLSTFQARGSAPTPEQFLLQQG
ncbi:hypothetical protein ElyMa_002421000 [Elysia marginata]|uniref:Uncharacterized protein n=1 Tax=Elysia marginata TaxID=1093978 RepID=A0AAV4GHN3_9GAST|nr:hypothetical protein ElyMa_002421000 [Elysia marginata]